MGMSYEFARNIEAAKAAGNDKALTAWQAQQDIFNSLRNPGVIKELPLEARPVEIPRPQEGSSIPEQLTIRESFTKAEKEALKKDGAVIYLLQGTTITSQREAQKSKNKPAFGYLVEAGDMLLAESSRRGEVVIYPEPKEFFVPNSFNRSVEEQEERVQLDGQGLRERLDLTAVTEIIPEEAATLTEVVFQHLDETGEWLFGKKYATAQGLDWVYGRTKNPTNSSGSNVADVGGADPAYGLDVNDWYRDHGFHCIGAVRLVVPVENR